MSTAKVPSGDVGHRGKQAPGLGEPQADYRITDLQEEVAHRNPEQQNHDFHTDPHQTGQVNKLRFNEGNHLVVGTITHAIPFINWYRVQVGEGGVVMPATFLSSGNMMPMGQRDTAPVGPNNNVILFVPPGLNMAYIIGTIPEELADGKIVLPDWVQQGGNTGVKRSDAHMEPFGLFREGGTIDWSSNRPIDSTGLEWGRICPDTGLMFHLDPFQMFMRVNEACGLFLNYWDSYCRLAGIQLDIQSYVQQMMQRYDEGENVHVDGNIIYPWEGMACYDSGIDFTQEFDSKGVHYTLPKGKIDLPDGEEDLQSVIRGMEYRGYLGQGYQRMVMAPKKQSGKRHYSDSDKDYGLFHEHIAMDGSYTLRSAKQVIIGKRVLIPIPKRKVLTEDQQKGDDARKDNYKFSSKFGGGPDHKVGDIEVNGENKHLLRVAGVLDILAYAYNWKGIHPFDYHENDYELPEESELDPFDRAMDNLDFGTLNGQEFMQDPSPRQLRVDHRYNQVEYFQRESYIALLEDGGIAIHDGFGAGIDMSGGQVRIHAPGDVQLLPGKRVVGMGGDVILRAKNSVDISASEKDVRLKAEKNMQLVAGNGGKGGLLLQSKATSKAHIYKNLYGEDVVSSGVVCLAKQSECAMLANEIYLRTGGGEIKDGRITIDASKGRKALVTYSRAVHMFNSRGVNIWHAPVDENANMVKSHRFSRNFSKIDGNLIIERNVCVTKGNLVVAKNIGAEKNIIAVKNLAHRPSPFVGFHLGQISFQSILDQCEQARELHVQIGEPVFNGIVVQRWYSSPVFLGNEELIRDIGFSYRDPPGSPRQYKANQFKMPMPRWQQMVEHGMGSGGNGWTEKPVIYQGQETYPWPGKQKWKEEQTLALYQQHEIFDQGQGHSKDRRGPYEEPKLSSFDEKTPDGNYKTIL
jgi:hypothetical protein